MSGERRSCFRSYHQINTRIWISACNESSRERVQHAMYYPRRLRTTVSVNLMSDDARRPPIPLAAHWVGALASCFLCEKHLGIAFLG